MHPPLPPPPSQAPPRGAPSTHPGALLALLGIGTLAWLVRALVSPAAKKVFISYDHSEDAHYRRMLSAWDRNSTFRFAMDDQSPRVAIDSTDAGVVRAALTRKLKAAEYLLVLVGPRTARSPWVRWEIDRAKARDVNLKLAAVKLGRGYALPPELRGCGAAIAQSFTRDNVIAVLDRARRMHP